MEPSKEQQQMVVAGAAAALSTPSLNLAGAYPEPAEWAMMKEIAKYVLGSGLMPENITKMKDPEAAATSIMLQGRELGLAPMRALYDIYIVNGRPSIQTDLMMALVARAEAGYIVTVEEYWDGTPKSFITRRAVRPGRPDEEYTFTWADAVKAGLTTKDIWVKYGKQMMEHRCTSILGRRMWPDVLRGMYTPEESEDIGAVESEFIDSAPVQAAEVIEAEVEPVGATLGDDGVKAFNETARALVAGYPTLQKTLAADVKAYLKKEFGIDKTADLPVAEQGRVFAFIGRLVAAEAGKGGVPAPEEASAPPAAGPSSESAPPPSDDLPDEQAMREEFYALTGDTTEAHRAWGKAEGPDEQLAMLKTAREAAAAKAAGQGGLDV